MVAIRRMISRIAVVSEMVVFAMTSLVVFLMMVAVVVAALTVSMMLEDCRCCCRS